MEGLLLSPRFNDKDKGGFEVKDWRHSGHTRAKKIHTFAPDVVPLSEIQLCRRRRLKTSLSLPVIHLCI